jgi:hypothetical protein
MYVGAILPADGGLEVLCQPRPIGLPQPVADPITHQRVQARVKEDGQNREFNAGTPGGSGNDVASDRVFVFFDQHVQKELLDFGGRNQFRLDFVCVLVVRFARYKNK